MRIVKKLLTLHWQFIYWIVGGAAILVICTCFLSAGICRSFEASTYSPNALIIQNSDVGAQTTSFSAKAQHSELLSCACNTRLSDILLIYLTFCLAVVGWFQIRSNDKSVKDLERAYVFFADAGLTVTNGLPTGQHVASIVAAFRNHGKTPAVVIGLRLECRISQNAPLPIDAPNETLPVGAIIDVTNPWTRSRTLSVTAAQANHGIGYSPPAYLYGEITYFDIFKQKHKTWFCRRYDGNQFLLSDLTRDELNGFT